MVFAGYPDITLRDFPALVRLPPEVVEASLANGVDLRFAGVDGEVFDYDIDIWNPDGDSLVWVRVPRLAQNTPAFAYWGNPRAWPQNQENTWSGGYIGVWHFNHANNIVRNAARPAMHARASNPHTVPGAVGNGLLLAHGWHLRAGESPILNLQGTLTVSGWFKIAEGTLPKNPWPLISHKAGSSQQGWEITTGGGSFNSIIMRGNRPSVGAVAMPADMGFEDEPRAWRHITAQYKGAGRGTLFVDGVKAGETNLGGGVASDIMCDLFIGHSPHNSSLFWRGMVDEVRIENVVRHDSWVRATYDTVMDSNFAAYGAPGPNDDSILLVAAHVGETNATLAGFHPAGAKAAAILHWGPADGGDDPAKWQNKAERAEGSLPGAPVFETAGLARGARYFARVAMGAEWGETLQFTTLPAPAPILGRVSIASAPGTNTLFTVRVQQLPPNPVLTLECGGQKHTLTPEVGRNVFAVPALPRNTPHPYAVALSGGSGRVETNGVFHTSHTSRWVNEPGVNYTNTYPTNHWNNAERWAGGVVPNGVGDAVVLNHAFGKTFIDGMGALTLGSLDCFNLVWNPFEILSTTTTAWCLTTAASPRASRSPALATATPPSARRWFSRGPRTWPARASPLSLAATSPGRGPCCSAAAPSTSKCPPTPPAASASPSLAARTPSSTRAAPAIWYSRAKPIPARFHPARPTSISSATAASCSTTRCSPTSTTPPSNSSEFPAARLCSPTTRASSSGTAARTFTTPATAWSASTAPPSSSPASNSTPRTTPCSSRTAGVWKWSTAASFPAAPTAWSRCGARRRAASPCWTCWGKTLTWRG